MGSITNTMSGGGNTISSNGNPKPNGGEYVFFIPEDKWSNHFSSLLMSGDILATVVEVVLVASLLVVATLYPHQVQAAGSIPLLDLGYFFILFSVIRRLYNSYLEAVFCTFPQYRTKPEKDLTGRDVTQLASIVKHDRLTLISQFLLDV